MASKSINRIFASLNQLPNPPPPPPSLRLRCAINYGENEELWDKNFVGKTMSTLINNSNPWSNGVESSLAELCPVLSEATVIQTLNLIKSSDDASEFFRWTQRMGFPPTEYSFFTMLEILGRSRDLIEARKLLFSIEKISGGSVKLVDRFFNSLIRSYGRAGMFQESINLFNSMKSLGVSPSVVTFNGLFSILLKRGRPAEALKLFDEMLGTYGVTPDTFTFNVLIRGFSLNGMAGEGFRFFKEMGRLRCEPDVITYNSLVDGLCRAGKMGVARNVIKGMEKKSPDLKPNVVTYTTLIRGYCMRREVDAALLIFNEITGQGLVPNDVTYNTLLKGLCEANRHEEIKEVLEGATRRGEFVPDTCTFNTLIHSHCVSGNLDEALKAFSKMSELKVQQDSATYSVLIRTLCQRGDYRKAEELFDELSEKEILLGDSGCKPLVASYNPIFKHLCSAGKSKKAERVFRQLMRRGTQDPKSYKTLIMGHCREGQFRAGFELLSLMLKREFDPDPEIFVSLIDGMLKTGNPLLAKVILENMVQRQHRPSRSTFHSILTELLNRGLAKQSASLITLMLKKRVVQNITISTRLMVLLFGSGEAGTAFEIMGLLYENGYIVNIEELVGFLCQKNMLLEACKVLRFGFPNHHSIDCELFNIVIAGLSKQGKAYEAFGLYYDLVENEVNDQLTCLEDLKRGLKAEGKIAEAMFVSNRKSIEQHRTSDQKNKEVKDSAAWFKLPRDGNSKVTRPTSSTQKKPTCNKQSNSLFT